MSTLQTRCVDVAAPDPPGPEPGRAPEEIPQPPPPPKRRRPKRLRARPPKLTEEMILAWCDDHRARTGAWPTNGSGIVLAALGETWGALDMALHQGSRGLPGGSSISRLLAARRGTRNKKGLPPLTEEAVLALADLHFKETGEWPTRKSGPVLGSPVPGETWRRVNDALVKGLRDLPGGSSLARLLAARRGVRNRKALPPLTEELILRWADAHFERHGIYPSESAGPVEDAPGEVWANVTMALRQGTRTLPGGSSLFRLLCKHGRVLPPKPPR
jgi:hypothetical protein